MKKIRILVVLFFLVSCVCYVTYNIKNMITDDSNAPVIKFEEEILTVSASATEDDMLAGVTASDEEDGDLTERIQIASISRLMGNNERTVHYIVFDDADNLGAAERTLIYADYTPPRIHSDRSFLFTIEEYDNKNNYLSFTASDSIDGDLTNKIRTTYKNLTMGEITPGSYGITVQVNNSAGDTCVVPIELVVVNKADKVGRYYPLLKEYIAYTKVGSSLDLQSYLKGISGDGITYIFGESGTPANISASKVSVNSHVDYETPGTYTVDYSYTTREGVTAVTTMYVVVED